MAKEDFGTIAKREYDELMGKRVELQKQIDEMDTKIKPLVLYLQAAGIIKPEKKTEGKKRGRKPKTEAAAQEA